MSESLNDRLAGLTPAQRALYELALKKKEQAKAATPAGAPAPAAAPAKAPRRRISRHDYGHRAPLSIDQERLWFIQQLDPESPIYNVYSAARYKARIEMPYVTRALNEFVRRHEILRTTFPAVNGRPVQEIRPHLEMVFPHVDLRGLPEERREEAAEVAANQVVTPPFDLLKLPMFRIVLIQVHEDDFIMPNCIHHILSDRVSYDFINVELFTLYEAFRAGQPSPLPEPEIQFADFAIWQREQLEGPQMAELFDYWKKRLDGAPELLPLPADRPRPPVQTPWGARRSMMIARQQADAFKALSAREEVTLFVGGLALFKAFLVRLSGQEKLVVGTPMDYRQGPEMEGGQGFYLNQLALYTDLSGNPTVQEVVQRVKETSVGAFSHHELPFAKVVEIMRPERDLSRIPFTQVVFLLITPHPTFGNLKPEHIASRAYWVDAHRTQFDMTFAIFWQDGFDVQSIWEHNTDLFDGVSVNRWKEQFRVFWSGFVADPQARLWDLPMLTEGQRQQVLREWNDTNSGMDRPVGLLTPERIAAQAARTPDAVAVAPATGDGPTLIYAELERRAGRMARHLQRLGLGPEDLVGVCLDRSPDLIAALLGVWKAGAAYLALDPSHPAERLAAIVADAGARAVLTDPAHLDRFPENGPRRLVLGGDGGIDLGADTGETAGVPLAPEALAYVLYTSGSTGQPKGVAISHAALASFLDAAAERYRLDSSGVWMAVTTITFDISVLEIYFPLASGARVALGGRDLAIDGASLGRALEETGATHLQVTPSGWRLLLDSGWAGKPGLRMLSGGEALPRELADRLLAVAGDAGEVWNQYGPTEATVWSTAARVEPGDGPVSLGRPLANTRVYLLDRHFGPVPQGTQGEVYLGGRGLARGYLGLPAVTAERFVPDPVSGEAGGRLYRTGDLARHLQDGRFAFLGRADHQIKLRGHRIELGEIEAALRSHPAVADGAVLMHGEGSRDGFLTGYLVLRKVDGVVPEVDPEELRAYLRRRLPEAMVPAAFVPLEALPLGRTGKVDRRRLEQMAPGGVLRPRRSQVAPRNANEEILFGIWTEILGPERVGDGFGVFDDFFALGGHSLIATQLLARIHDAFQIELPVRTVFQASTVAAQAGVVAAALAGEPAGAAGSAAGAGPIRRLPREEGQPLVAPLSFAQERLWFLDRLTPGLAVYNMPLAMRVTGALDLAALDRTFTAVVARHESLRTTFPDVAGQPFQQVLPAEPWSVQGTDLTGEADPQGTVERLVHKEGLAPFDLAAGPVLRTHLLRLGPQEHVLLLSMHHIVSDLWSMSVLIQDVAALYPSFAAGNVPSLPDLAVQYADFAVWQREWLQGDELERQLAYWRRRLAGAPAALELPTDRPRPATQTYRGGGFLFDLPAELSAGLLALGERERATPFMLISAALGVLLGRLAGQDDVVLGFPVADRRRPELEGLIGMFVNTLPLRVELGGGPPAGLSFADLLARVREVALETFEHQDVPFERIVEDLQPRRDLSRHPVFQATLSVQNVPFSRVDLEGLALEPLGADFTLTKFDLGIMIYDIGGRLSGRMEYAADLFDDATAERWMGHLRTLLRGVVARPDRPLSEVPLLSDDERRQILADWNQTAAEYPPAPLHALFAEQAERTPDAVAVVCGSERLTYGELRERAGRLARRLRAVGVGENGAETPVGLLAGRTTGLAVGLLGILEAGGAYLPLDPAYPPERLQFVLGDAAAAVLVAEPALLEGPLAGAEAGRRLVELGSEADGEEAPAFPPVADPDRLAYVMYTSGSTGEPKGVAVTHRNVVRLVRSAAGERAYADFGPDRTFLQLAPIAFDASTLEIWGPLLNGGRLVLNPGDRSSLDDLAEVIRRDGVDSLWLTAGLFHQIVDLRPEALRPLKQLLAGGDVISAAHVRRLLEALPGLAFVNGYGPTEGTTFTCCHRVTAPEQVDEPLPIGRPIANARVHVLDRVLRPVPVGAGGELYLGGDGLTRGYLDRPALTAERFVPDPFGPGGARLYRTGDLVRWRPDGALEFLGRNDGQVKVRGFRVEPAEVESVLARHPAVRQAAVGVVADPAGDRALAAYLVPRESQNADLPDQLRAYLKAWVPEPMVPAVWRILEELPLTANGKVDRRALADLGAGATPQAAGRPPYEPPTTPLETDLVEICAEVLGLDRVGIRDNFFDLGGHSLLGTQLIARMLDRSGIEVPLYALFEATDFADLADRIMEEQLSQADEGELGDVLEELEGQAGTS